MGFHIAITTGVVDWIVNGILSAIEWLLKTVLSPLVWLAYRVFVVAPLLVIDGMVKIFKFFSMGLTPYIFGTSISPDGKVSYNFDWGGPIAKIMYVVFGLSMIIFTFFFLLSFTKNVVDENGRPTKMQSKRIYYLKWPFMMMMLMLLTPILLVGAETLMSALVSSFTNDLSSPLTKDEAASFTANFVKKKWANYYGNIQDGVINIGGESMLVWLTHVGSHLQQAADDMNKNTKDGYNFGLLPGDLETCCNIMNEMKTYLNSGLVNTNNRLIALNVQAGYISQDQHSSIAECITAISNFQSDALRLNSIFTDLVSTTNDEIMAAWKDYDKMKGVNDYENIIKPALQTYIAGMDGSNTGIETMYYWFGDKNGDMTYHLLNSTMADDGTIGLYDIATRMKGLKDFSVCPVLYEFTTGLNRNTWRTGPSLHDITSGGVNMIHFLSGVFMIFAMFLIMFTYLQTAIKRIYLLIGYWIIGWFLMANGMNEPGPVKNWYKTLFGTWIGILFLYICFSLAGVVEQLVEKPILDGLTPYDSKAGLGDNFISTAGMLFSMEAAYQVMYQVSQKVMTSLGTSESGAKSFSASSSMALTQGKALATKTLSNVWDVAKLKHIREAVTSWGETKDYWAARRDAKIGRANQENSQVGNKLKIPELRKRANMYGYDIKITKKRNNLGDWLPGNAGTSIGVELVPLIKNQKNVATDNVMSRVPSLPPDKPAYQPHTNNKKPVMVKPLVTLDDVGGSKGSHGDAVLGAKNLVQGHANVENSRPIAPKRPLPTNPPKPGTAQATAGWEKQTIVAPDKSGPDKTASINDIKLGLAEAKQPDLRMAMKPEHNSDGNVIYGNESKPTGPEYGKNAKPAFIESDRTSIPVTPTKVGYYDEPASQKVELYDANKNKNRPDAMITNAKGVDIARPEHDMGTKLRSGPNPFAKDPIVIDMDNITSPEEYDAAISAVAPKPQYLAYLPSYKVPSISTGGAAGPKPTDLKIGREYSSVKGNAPDGSKRELTPESRIDEIVSNKWIDKHTELPKSFSELDSDKQLKLVQYLNTRMNETMPSVSYAIQGSPDGKDTIDYINNNALADTGSHISAAKKFASVEGLSPQTKNAIEVYHQNAQSWENLFKEGRDAKFGNFKEAPVHSWDTTVQPAAANGTAQGYEDKVVYGGRHFVPPPEQVDLPPPPPVPVLPHGWGSIDATEKGMSLEQVMNAQLERDYKNYKANGNKPVPPHPYGTNPNPSYTGWPELPVEQQASLSSMYDSKALDDELATAVHPPHFASPKYPSYLNDPKNPVGKLQDEYLTPNSTPDELSNNVDLSNPSRFRQGHDVPKDANYIPPLHHFGDHVQQDATPSDQQGTKRWNAKPLTEGEQNATQYLRSKFFPGEQSPTTSNTVTTKYGGANSPTPNEMEDFDDVDETEISSPKKFGNNRKKK